MDALRVFTGLEVALPIVGSQEDTDEAKRARETVLLAARNGWKRPFAALATIAEDRRDLVRQTLDFKWDKSTLESNTPRYRAQFEAWEIIDCDIRGIAGRLHSIAEQLNPVRYITWRQALIRALELAQRQYKATATEEELEALVLDVFESEKRMRPRDQTDVPDFGLPKSKGGFIFSTLKDIAKVFDDVVGSEDGPALAAMYSICEALKE